MEGYLNAECSRACQAKKVGVKLDTKLLAAKAGIPLATYRRFESLGEISLRGLVMIAISLDAEDDLGQLFSAKNYQSIDELIDSTKIEQRKRATRNE